MFKECYLKMYYKLLIGLIIIAAIIIIICQCIRYAIQTQQKESPQRRTATIIRPAIIAFPIRQGYQLPAQRNFTPNSTFVQIVQTNSDPPRYADLNFFDGPPPAYSDAVKQ